MGRVRRGIEAATVEAVNLAPYVFVIYYKNKCVKHKHKNKCAM